MNRMWVILLLLFFHTYTNGQCKVERKTFSTNEQLTYKAFYNWNFIWLEAANINFSVKSINYKNLELSSVGNSLPKYDWFYMVRDTFISHINKETLKPYFHHRNTKEGSYQVNNKYYFNWTQQKAFTNTDNSKFGKAKDTIELPLCTFDVLTAIYYTRSISFKNKIPGEKIPLTFLIDNEIYELYIRYLGKETLITRFNDRYNCIKLSVLLVEGTIFSGGEEMIIWATDDQNQIPIQIEAKITVGSVKAILSDYKNIRYPLTSWLGKVKIEKN